MYTKKYSKKWYALILQGVHKNGKTNGAYFLQKRNFGSDPLATGEDRLTLYIRFAYRDQGSRDSLHG